MDYNNFSHYAQERMNSLRGEGRGIKNRGVERWYTLGAKKTPLARLRTFLETLTFRPAARQPKRHS
jgi:hypothetical protein